MANSNNTQLSASETASAKRAANDAAYGALYGAVIGANPTGSNQYPNANGSMTQADINALRGMTAQDYLNAFGTAGKPGSTSGNSFGSNWPMVTGGFQPAMCSPRTTAIT